MLINILFTVFGLWVFAKVKNLKKKKKFSYQFFFFKKKKERK